LKTTDPTKPVLMISLSKALSSTYGNALTSKNQILSEKPSREIAVINTKSASCGTALIIHEEKEKMKEDYSFEDIVSHLEDKVEDMSTLFLLKSLDNLIISGRLDKVKCTIAKTLNIKL